MWGWEPPSGRREGRTFDDDREPEREAEAPTGSWPGKRTLVEVVQRKLRPHGAIRRPISALPKPGPGEPLPRTLAAGLTTLSGLDLSGVRVHRDSDRPEAIGAHAYAEGRDIFLAPGQEHHLPHEAWHVVQQLSGRTPATSHRQGLPINDDPSLEREADEMGERARTSAPAPVAWTSAPAPAAPPAHTTITTPVAQGVFERDGVPKGTPQKWIDGETGAEYVCILAHDGGGTTTLLLQRVSDEFLVTIASKDGGDFEPQDGDQQYREARLHPERPWREVVGFPSDDLYDSNGKNPEPDLDDDEDDLEWMRFVQGESTLITFKKDDHLVLDRKDGSKKTKKDRRTNGPKRRPRGKYSNKPKKGNARPDQRDLHGKPPDFAIRVAVVPDSDDKNTKPEDQNQRATYTAAQLLVYNVHSSIERLPTQFGVPQKHHTVSFGLIREALAALRGLRLSDLIDFVFRALDDLLSDDEPEYGAQHDAMLGRPEPSFRATLHAATLPVHLWCDVAGNLLYHYMVAFQKSAAATYNKNSSKKPFNRGEHDALSHLREVEEAIRNKEITDRESLNTWYDRWKVTKKELSKRQQRRLDTTGSVHPTPLTDIDDLIEITINKALPALQANRALQHWYELLWLSFPGVMSLIYKDIVEQIHARKLSPSSKRETNTSSFAELFGDGKPPIFNRRPLPSPPPIKSSPKNDLGASVRLDPIDGVVRRDYSLDELELGRIRVGAKRVKTKSGTDQRAHTVAHELLRQSLMSFSGQPFENLHAYLLQAVEDLFGTFGKNEQAEKDARALRDNLRQLAGVRLDVGYWTFIAAEMLTEYVRLYNLTTHATYDQPSENQGESAAVKLLQRNELSLLSDGVLIDPPTEIATRARVLLDATVDHALLPWRELCRAVLHWEQSLWTTFPTLMAVARGQVTDPVYRSPCDGGKGYYQHWVGLPTVGGRPVATIRELVDAYLAERGGAPRDFVGRLIVQRDHRPIEVHAWRALDDGNSGFNALALGLVRLVNEGALARSRVVGSLPGVSNEVWRRVLSLARGTGAPSDRRSIQTALAPALRALARELLDRNKGLLNGVRIACLMEIARLVEEARNAMKDGNVNDGEPPESQYFPAGSSILLALWKLALKIAPEDGGSPKMTDEELSAWVEVEGTAHYLSDLKAGRIDGTTCELEALARHFGVDLVIFSGEEDTLRTRTLVEHPGVPVRIHMSDGVLGEEGLPEFTEQEIGLLLCANLIQLTIDPRPEIILGHATPAEIATALGEQPELAKRFLALVSEHAAPILGLHTDDSQWNLVRTPGRSTNVARPNGGRGDPPELGTWKSRGTHSGLRNGTRNGVSGKIVRRRNDTALGSFTPHGGGRRHIAWETSGDGNCAFNAFGMALVGLVAQGRLDRSAFAGPLGLSEAQVAQLLDYAARVRTDRGAGAQIERMLARPLREAASRALRERQDLKHGMFAELLAELRGRIYQMYGLEWRGFSDLFTSRLSGEIDKFITGTVEEVLSAVNTAITGVMGDAMVEEAEDEGGRTQRRLLTQRAIDGWVDEAARNLGEWFLGEGINLYIADMETDAVHAGGPELHALARLFGVAVTIFRDFGTQVGRDEGQGNAGSAPATTLADWEVDLLRMLDVIEGVAVIPGDPRIHFRRLTRDQVVARFGEGELYAMLRDKFLALYDAHYAYLDRAPIEVGMYRHFSYDHWSTVTTDRGAYDLGDDGGYLGELPVPTHGVDEAYRFSWDIDIVPDGGSIVDSPGGDTSGVDGSSRAGKVHIDRVPLKAPGVTTTYGDHMYGTYKDTSGKPVTAPFSLNKIDPGIDLTKERVGLVNAANSTLLGGGGIDGAIHQVGDQKGGITKDVLSWKTDTGVKGLPAGGAMRTGPGELQEHGIHSIIHTVGPDGRQGEPLKLLENCVIEILNRAVEQKLTTLIFCNISSGVFGFSEDETAKLIMAVLERELTTRIDHGITRIVFNNFPPQSPPKGTKRKRQDDKIEPEDEQEKKRRKEI